MFDILPRLDSVVSKTRTVHIIAFASKDAYSSDLVPISSAPWLSVVPIIYNK